jgi:phage shock protein C
MALKRDMNDKMLGGICSGLSKYLECQPMAIRIVFVLAFFLLGGFPACAVYGLLWLLLPKEET